MSLLDRLRPKWHHSDPDVRVEAVRQLGRDEQELLGAVARHDEDVRVRRAAIKKLDDAGVLLEIAEQDSDPALRDLAAERAEGALVVLAGSAGPVAECVAALSRIASAVRVATVAKTAAHAGVREAALARLTDQKTLGEVARTAAAPETRHGALGRVTDSSVLRSIASGDGPADIALAALERIDDPEVLHAIAQNRAVLKNVRHGAEARLDALIGHDHPIRIRQRHERQQALCATVEAAAQMANVAKAAEHVHNARQQWGDVAAQTPPDAGLAARFEQACQAVFDEVARKEQEHAEQARLASDLAENLAARGALCERVESLDGEGALQGLGEAKSTWDRLAPVPIEEGRPLAQRFLQACERCESRYRRWQQRDTFRRQLEALVLEAEALTGSGGAPETSGRWAGLEQRWRVLEASADPHNQDPAEPALRQRLAQAGERLLEQLKEANEQLAQRKAENLARVTALCARLEELAAAEVLDSRAADRELQAAAAALRQLGPLPPAEKRHVWRTRLSEARQTLQRCLHEQRGTEEWRRWANADVQEKLIQQTEALLQSEDLTDVARQLRRIREEWREASTAPADQSQALWARYRKARDELRQRCHAFFTENLQKKEALCAQVEALAESTDWKETAEAIKRLQAEWKEIGPIPRKKAQALWQRFRAPCDRFFERRNEHSKQLKAEWEENAKKKEALCARVEAIADSSEWEKVADEIKGIQAEWKRIGPAPRKRSDALWARFRAACDRFFDRRKRRGEIELEQQLESAEVACRDLESLVVALQGSEAPAAGAISRTIDASWTEWKRMPPTSSTAVTSLRDRFRRAWEQIGAARPESLHRTPLDPQSHRKRREKLCTRMEELLESCSPSAAASLGDLASKLKLALAANTIGGSAGPRRMSRRETAEEAERLRANWDRLGPVLGDGAEVLSMRFEQAYTDVRRRVLDGSPRGPQR
jgi:hypothetical protein